MKRRICWLIVPFLLSVPVMAVIAWLALSHGREWLRFLSVAVKLVVIQ